MEGKQPVREGDEVTVVIESIGNKGDGIAKVSGFVIFIPEVKENEKVKVKITKVLEKVGFGEVVEHLGVEEPKPKERRQPRNVVPPPQVEPSPDDSESFGEDLEDNDDELDEFEALSKA